MHGKFRKWCSKRSHAHCHYAFCPGFPLVISMFSEDSFSQQHGHPPSLTSEPQVHTRSRSTFSPYPTISPSLFHLGFLFLCLNHSHMTFQHHTLTSLNKMSFMVEPFRITATPHLPLQLIWWSRPLHRHPTPSKSISPNTMEICIIEWYVPPAKHHISL